MEDLTGRVAVVTGAGSGIGRGAALALARAGVGLILADISTAGLDESVRAAQGLGGQAIGVRCDVGARDTFAELRDAGLARFGRIDILMNNAGVLSTGFPDQIPVAEWERVLNINLMAVVRSLDAFLPGFIAAGQGHIVNTASMSGVFPYSYVRSPYSVSKAAVIALSEDLALYLKPKGIGVTCFCPGPVRTNIGPAATHFGPPAPSHRLPGSYVPISAEQAGEMVVGAIRADRFLLFTHPEHSQADLMARARDWEGFVAAQAARLAAGEP